VAKHVVVESKKYKVSFIAGIVAIILSTGAYWFVLSPDRYEREMQNGMIFASLMLILGLGCLVVAFFQYKNGKK